MHFYMMYAEKGLAIIDKQLEKHKTTSKLFYTDKRLELKFKDSQVGDILYVEKVWCYYTSCS